MKIEHGIASPDSLKAAHKIEVDSKLTYNLPSALDIELVGPAKRAQIIHSIYTRSVSRGVLNSTTNKNTADLNKNRSKDFMVELEKSPPKPTSLATKCT